MIGCLSCCDVSLSVNPLDALFYYFYFFLLPYFNLATLNVLWMLFALFVSMLVNTARSRNATYYSAKFAYSQSQYTISSITQKYGADQTVTRNLLVAIISLRLCAINVSQTSLLLMETLSSGMAMEFVRCSLCCKAKYGSSQEMKTISPPLCSPWPAKIFQYFRRFVPKLELMFESF